MRTFALALAFTVLSAATARADTIPDFKWDDLLNTKVVWNHLEPRIQRLSKEPDDFELRINTAKLAYIMWRLEKSDNAKRIRLANLVIKASQEATKLRPKDPAGYFWLGGGIGMLGTTRGMLESLQLLPELKKAFETSIELDPNYIHSQALAHMGHLYIRLPGFPVSVGDKAKGLQYLKESIKRDGKDAVAYLYLADFYWMHGDVKNARENLEKVLAAKADCAEQFFTNEVSKRKAREILAMIDKGTPRDPFYDVTSELQPAVIR